MEQPAAVSVVFQTLSPQAATTLADAIRDLESADLPCAVEVHQPDPQAFLEWLFPTALLLWMGDKYFGAMLSEAGKDHYKLLKSAMEKVYEKTLKPGASVARELRRQDGARVEDAYFSGNLSFGYASPEGWNVKLLFPLDTTADDYRQSCIAFARLVTEHAAHRDASPLEAEIRSVSEEKAEYLPEEITATHMRHRVRLLVFWNAAKAKFYVPDPVQSGVRGQLVTRPLGVAA